LVNYLIFNHLVQHWFVCQQSHNRWCLVSMLGGIFSAWITRGKDCLSKCTRAEWKGLGERKYQERVLNLKSAPTSTKALWQNFSLTLLCLGNADRASSNDSYYWTNSRFEDYQLPVSWKFNEKLHGQNDNLKVGKWKSSLEHVAK
jgi:hypothetical protein